MNKTQLEQLKQLPQVQKLLESERANELMNNFSRNSVAHGVRRRLDEARQAIRTSPRESPAFSDESFFQDVREDLEHDREMRLRRVINATGIVLHTNLGRAPLSEDALTAITNVARGYSNLELDLETGKRGARYDHVENILCSLTRAESAVVVNNNAAAVMLMLNTMSMDSEVIISRGELIEIGGSFRIPEVITRSGSTLVEVGATNKTRLSDYEKAITPKTTALMKVHPSNFKIMGFTESTSREELVALARRHEILLIEDLGSGTLIDLAAYGLPHETTVQEVVDAGVELVSFSGDKLLGGPQAGIIVGKKDLVDQMKKNPLIRGFRIDKLSLAALEATLRLYLDPDRLSEKLPVLKRLAATPEDLLQRAETLAAELNKIKRISARILDGESFSGGGALPHERLPTKVVEMAAKALSPDQLAAALRNHQPPVLARISDGAVLLDVRTMADDEIGEVIDAARRITA